MQIKVNDENSKENKPEPDEEILFLEKGLWIS